MTDPRQSLRAALHAEEAPLVRALIARAGLDGAARAAISSHAADLVRGVRAAGRTGMMELFLAEYGLSTREGVALMCLAEALLRVPDTATIDDLIRDKIAPHDWGAHLGDSGSILVNASTWALMLTGRVLEAEPEGIAGALRGLVRRMGEPVIRAAVARAMREMGDQFVLGETIGAALARGAGAAAASPAPLTHSFDMLGEAARTEADAARYLAAYHDAIAAIGRVASGDVRADPGISVKLSALHPRYEVAQAGTMVPDLSGRLLDLARAARAAGIGFNIDAEEADRLDLSLDVIGAVLAGPGLAGWDGFGVVVQAYGRRAPHVLDWLHAQAAGLGRRIMVRLVKGAYWDAEVKRAQVLGLPGYPVFTTKTHTDVSYIACARMLLGMTDRIYPQFATHNAHSMAAILHMAGPRREGFEFQRLHGMGEVLHDIVGQAEGTRTRVYAPVGTHRDLLAYLVRRLLENGANSSFVHQIVDESVAPEVIAADPLGLAEARDCAPNPGLPAPSELYGAGRVNSRGWDLSDPLTLAALDAARAPFRAPHVWDFGAGLRVVNPADPDEPVGSATPATGAEIAAAVRAARAAQPGWGGLGPAVRAVALLRIAGEYEAAAGEIFALLHREAGKTLADAVAELREAVDFLRYYAAEALRPSPGTAPCGLVVCISPWNFPLAIFTGQIAAALVTGNAVLAKPSEETPLIAARAVALMQAHLPPGVLQLVQGDGTVGAALVAEPGLGAVAFTGSTPVARAINGQLARTSPLARLVAETGGINAMIVDSTALPEQAVRDILAGAFQSAGQRCSALRLLCVQEEVAAGLTEMLTGAMDTLVVGDPGRIATDVGPVIGAEARAGIEAWVAAQAGRVLHRTAMPARGHFVAPTLIGLDRVEDLTREVFGPVLHLVRFKAGELRRLVGRINALGYGLTLGFHSRIDARVQEVVDAARVGNLYVNRNQIGAVVGVQPFGGEGLSGTGPKAGGPQALEAFRRDADPAGTGEGLVADAQAARGAGGSGTGKVLTASLLGSSLAGLPDAGWGGDRLTRLRAALRGRAAEAMARVAALDCGPLDLPGPTGESNQLRLLARGVVLVLGPGAEEVLAQTVLALGTGNRVLAVAPDARAALAPLLAAGAPLAVREGRVGATALTGLAIDAVALRPSPGFADLRAALAAREGPILPLIARLTDPAAFTHERCLSIDTTAAGGNADLMARAG